MIISYSDLDEFTEGLRDMQRNGRIVDAIVRFSTERVAFDGGVSVRVYSAFNTFSELGEEPHILTLDCGIDREGGSPTATQRACEVKATIETICRDGSLQLRGGRYSV